MRDLETATLPVSVSEPQHDDNLVAVFEHEREWVSCNRCGRQWAIHGSDIEVVTDGDGYCDEASS